MERRPGRRCIPGWSPVTASAPTAVPDADVGTLEVDHLTVHYGHVVAVEDVTLSVDKGEAVALLGPNGAGKTSILRAISGLVASTGDISFSGRSTRSERPEALARQGLLHVPEGRRLFSGLDVHENLLVGRTAASGRTEGFNLDDIYELFPALVPLRHRAAWALSGGEQQMVAIGRALVGAPRLLLLDEPSLGLAPVVMHAVFDALHDIVTRVPVLLVEQNTVAALALCQRAYVLSGGHVVLSGASEDLADRSALLDTYLR